MKRTLTALALTTALALPAAAQDRLSVMLDWFVNPDHAPIILAQELGYFDQAGLAVEIVTPPTPTTRRAWPLPVASIWRCPISRNCT